METKNVTSTSVRVIVIWVTSRSSLWFLGQESWLREKQYDTLVTELEHVPHSVGHHPSPAKACHPAVAINASFAGHSSVLSGLLFQSDGRHGQTSKFCELEDYFREVTKALFFLTQALNWELKAWAHHCLFFKFFSTVRTSQLNPQSLYSLLFTVIFHCSS